MCVHFVNCASKFYCWSTNKIKANNAFVLCKGELYCVFLLLHLSQIINNNLNIIYIQYVQSSSSRSYRLAMCTTLSSVHNVSPFKYFYTSCFARSMETIGTIITLSQAKLRQRVATLYTDGIYLINNSKIKNYKLILNLYKNMKKWQQHYHKKCICSENLKT